jgi:flagellar protein FliS
MMNHRAEDAYQENAVRSADSLQLVVMLHDMLVRDIRSAITATRDADVQQRSNELKHAFAVLEQLQGTLDMKSGGDAATNMDRLYSLARSRLLQAHANADVRIMDEQLQIFESLREAWKSLLPTSKVQGQTPAFPSAADDAPQHTWSV